MARAKSANVKPDFVDDDAVSDDEINATVSEIPEDWEFETVSHESPTRIQFDTSDETAGPGKGDRFVGQYVDLETVTPENDDDPFDLYVFRGRNDRLYSVNKSYKLEKGMATVKKGDWVLLAFIKEIPVSKGNPMKDITVAVRRK